MTSNQRKIIDRIRLKAKLRATSSINQEIKYLEHNYSCAHCIHGIRLNEFAHNCKLDREQKKAAQYYIQPPGHFLEYCIGWTFPGNWLDRPNKK